MTAAVLTRTDGGRRPPALLFPGAMPVLAVFAFWAAVGVLAAVADYSDQIPSPELHFSARLQLYDAVFLPFALFSTALSFAFARFPLLLRPRRLLLPYLVALLLFLPVYGLCESAAVHLLEHQPLPGLAEMLAQPSAWNLWLALRHGRRQDQLQQRGRVIHGRGQLDLQQGRRWRAVRAH